MEKRIIYYSSFDDDFAGTDINTQHVPEDFPFTNDNPLWKATGSFIYYVIARPVGWALMKTVFGLKIENKEAFKKIGDTGVFFYGNHTQLADVFYPPLSAGLRRCTFVAGPDTVSIKGIKQLVLMLGALPIPDTVHGLKRFVDAIDKFYKEKRCIVIYPEAHIWPYYTGVRPFKPTSFTYPAKLKAPVVAAATVYRKRKGLTSFIKAPAFTVIISDPIYPKEGLSSKENAEYLRDRVYEFLREQTSREDNYEYVRYIRKDSDADKD